VAGLAQRAQLLKQMGRGIEARADAAQMKQLGSPAPAQSDRSDGDFELEQARRAQAPKSARGRAEAREAFEAPGPIEQLAAFDRADHGGDGALALPQVTAAVQALLPGFDQVGATVSSQMSNGERVAGGRSEECTPPRTG
jgi:hypothetical protein